MEKVDPFAGLLPNKLKRERPPEQAHQDDAPLGEIGDDEVEDGSQQGPADKATAMQRHRNALFETFTTRKIMKMSKDEVSKIAHSGAADDAASLKELMAKQQSTSIISSPRDYQMELFERAKVQNTIAVLDTGAGKTLIAVLLLRHVLEEELERRLQGRPNRIAFFLVPKVVLVFQQSAVLEANLDHSIAQVCGDSEHLWEQDVWKNHLENTMIIVATPECVLQALHHSFIRIDQISLLIFDEAHHAKKDHPYARIISQYYVPEKDSTKRPRIFGTTASPVDAYVGESIEEKAKELEGLLNARIATASNMALLQKAVFRPVEHVLLYNKLPPQFKTSLHLELADRFGEDQDFKKLFQESPVMAQELGVWCAEHYWKYALSEREQSKKEAKTQQRFYKKKDKPIEELDAEIERLKEAYTFAVRHDFPPPTLENLSPKVALLREELVKRYERPTDIRCLVFVERKATARLLALLFDQPQIGTQFLKPAALVGSGSSSYGAEQTSYKTQVMTMFRFRDGKINCLFATSVAEEGLDIQDCNLIIRFDLCKTTIQYVQSRGRARHKNSTFLHMMEKDNHEHEDRLQIIKDSQQVMDEFCRTLPKDRLIAGSEVEWDEPTETNSESTGFTIKSTGARLTYDFSLNVLAHFVACLRENDNDDDLTPTYMMRTILNNRFRCEVILPEKSPVKSAVGRIASRKSSAKRSAAFEVCIELFKRGYLTDHLLPAYCKKLPELRNARLALASKKSHSYEMQVKPIFWQNGLGQVPSTLFLTEIILVDAWDRPTAPLALLTRNPLPQIPEFPIFRNNGDQSRVRIISQTNAISLEPFQLHALTSFTLRLFKDVFNKEFENDKANMWYWIGPLSWNPSDLSVQDLTLDWNLLQSICGKPSLKWTTAMKPEDLRDKFFIDPWDGGRRFISSHVHATLKATDVLPDGVNNTGRHVGPQATIIDYSVSLYKQSKARRAREWNLEQPVISGEKILHRLNVLADATDTERNAITQAVFCPEPLDISLLPAKYATAGLVFPAIIHRIESYLVALECADRLDLQLPADLALEAITKDSDNQDEHDKEKIEFQRGMGPNYERLEFIGDCFLKMATSTATYVRFANHDQFAMHCERMLLLCNKTLFEYAEKHDYQKYIRGKAFNRRDWYPKGSKLLKGKGANKVDDGPKTQPLSKKTIADICEALIGASYVSHLRTFGLENTDFDMAVKAVKTFVDSSNHPMTRWQDYWETYKNAMPEYQTSPATAAHLDLAKKVQKEHDYCFKYPRLLACAFKHPTSPRSIDKLPSYERLEFLGDSLLDMACVSHLFNKYPDKDPQWLTEHKMPVVSNQFLGTLCVEMGFHKHLQYHSQSIMGAITSWVGEAQDAKRQSGARDYWQSLREPPKCLADIVESYVGAIFIDSGFNYAVVRQFFEAHILWFFEDMSLYDNFAGKHPIARLRRFLQDNMGCKDWQLMVREVPADDGTTKTFAIAGLVVHKSIFEQGGQGSSSKGAKIEAAQNAIDELEGLAPFEFRARYGCDCKADDRQNEHSIGDET